MTEFIFRKGCPSASDTSQKAKSKLLFPVDFHNPVIVYEFKLYPNEKWISILMAIPLTSLTYTVSRHLENYCSRLFSYMGQFSFLNHSVFYFSAIYLLINMVEKLRHCLNYNKYNNSLHPYFSTTSSVKGKN